MGKETERFVKYSFNKERKMGTVKVLDRLYRSAADKARVVRP